MRCVNIDLIGVPAFVVNVGPDGDFRTIALNRADEEATGFRSCDMVDRRIEDCVSPEMARYLLARLSECVARRTLYEYDERFGPDDNVRWWRTTLTPVIDPDIGRVVQIVGISVEITARKEAEGILSDAAFRDPLTGLANRRRIEREVEAAIAKGSRPEGGFGLAVIDLDAFKSINDTYGHRRGDDVLRHIGSILKLTVGQDETAARLGGDEFAVKLTVSSDAELRKRVGDLGRLLDRDLTIADQPMRIGASIGSALWASERSFDELFDRADAGMYREKTRRRAIAPSLAGVAARAPSDPLRRRARPGRHGLAASA